jgi:transposase
MSLHPNPIGQIPAETQRVARAAFPRGTVVTRLRDEFAELYRDEDFAALYPRRGKPGLAPWRLALVTVLQFLEHLSDRQAADAVRSRIDWKYALGLRLDDAGFHFSVLTEFRARLLAGQAESLLLDRMLAHFKARGLIKPRGRQRTDSTHVLGAVRDLHLLELVTETMRAALNELATVAPRWLLGVAEPAWFERYVQRAEDWRLPGGSKQERAAYAQQVGTDGFALLDALDAESAPAAARQGPMLAALRSVWQTHFERRNDGPPRWRDGAELPPVGERIQSPYDPQMHYSAKRGMEWSGYKVHVTETCDSKTAHVITDVETRPAMEFDISALPTIHMHLAARGMLPKEHFVDSAYVSAALLEASRREHGISLQGPVRGLSTWASRVGPGYDLPNFKINWEQHQVTCPEGKVSVGWTPGFDEAGRPRIHVRFGRGDCGSCQARTLCTPAKEARRTIYFHPRQEYEALNNARKRMREPAWKKKYRVRAGVEGTLSQGVRAFGMRRSRYVGLAKTALQELLAAVGINVARIVEWLDGCARAKTRVSRFARLRPSQT